jgi:hypothetical protein
VAGRNEEINIIGRNEEINISGRNEAISRSSDTGTTGAVTSTASVGGYDQLAEHTPTSLLSRTHSPFTGMMCPRAYAEEDSLCVEGAEGASLLADYYNSESDSCASNPGSSVSGILLSLLILNDMGFKFMFR